MKFKSLVLLLLLLSCIEARRLPPVAFRTRSQAQNYLPKRFQRSIDLRGGADRSYDEESYKRRNNNNRYYRNDEPHQYEADDEYYGTLQQQQQQQEQQYPEDDRYYDREYDDRIAEGPSPTGRATESIKNMSKLIQNGNRKIGLPLLAAGAVFTLLGVSLFFNKSLLRLGNLLFMAGVPVTIGPGRTAGYFFQPKKSRATGCLAVGIFLVLVGWPVFGMALEIFGLLNLFGNMFPIVTAMLKQMPVIGPILKGNQGGSKRRRDVDDYYNDGDQEEYSGRKEQYYEGDRHNGEYERDQRGDSYY